MKKCFLLFFIFIGSLLHLYAQSTEDLSLSYKDIFIEQDNSYAGIRLYINRKYGVSSVLLLNYEYGQNCASNTSVYRDVRVNNINGLEKRMFQGKFVQDLDGFKHALVSSTILTDNKGFDTYFLIFIPYTVLFKNKDGRYQGLNITSKYGFYFDIRTFTSLYANEKVGRFKDNLFFIKKKK